MWRGLFIIYQFPYYERANEEDIYFHSIFFNSLSPCFFRFHFSQTLEPCSGIDRMRYININVCILHIQYNIEKHCKLLFFVIRSRKYQSPYQNFVDELSKQKTITRHNEKWNEAEVLPEAWNVAGKFRHFFPSLCVSAPKIINKHWTLNIICNLGNQNE